MKRFLQVATVVGLLFAGRPASAADYVSGYVCSLQYDSTPDEHAGNYGRVLLWLSGGVNCTGAHQSPFQLLSQGAVPDSSMQSRPDARYLYSETALVAFHASLLAALATNTRVDVALSGGWQVTGLRFNKI